MERRGRGDYDQESLRARRAYWGLNYLDLSFPNSSDHRKHLSHLIKKMQVCRAYTWGSGAVDLQWGPEPVF